MPATGKVTDDQDRDFDARCGGAADCDARAGPGRRDPVRARGRQARAGRQDLAGRAAERRAGGGDVPRGRHAKITGGLSDRGYWRLWEQGYCTQWYRMRKGAERCFTLDRTADGKIRVFKPDGEISMTILSTEPIK